MSQSNIVVHGPQLIETTPVFGQGEPRWYGACSHCGDIDEFRDRAAAEDWVRVGLCECCEESLAQEENEARWYRAGPF